jgi:phage-related protein (TIGR01555 family)
MKKAQRTYTKVKDKKNIKLDHLVNVYSGSGVVGIDKSLADTYKFNKKRPEDLLSLYRDSSIARKIVDKEVRASSREGYKIIFKEDNLEASNWIYKRMKDLDFDNKFMDACIWSRLYGGCGIIIGILDGTSKMQEEYVPLNFNKIDYLTVVDSTKLEPSGQLIESDISSPNYSLPIYYKVNSGSKASASQNEKIHYSRIIKFHGVKIPLDALSQNNYWGDSVLQSIYSELNNYNSHNKTIRNVSENISIKIFKLKELREQILLSSEAKTKTKKFQTLFSKLYLNYLRIELFF